MGNIFEEYKKKQTFKNVVIKHTLEDRQKDERFVNNESDFERICFLLKIKSSDVKKIAQSFMGTEHVEISKKEKSFSENIRKIISEVLDEKIKNLQSKNNEFENDHNYKAIIFNLNQIFSRDKNNISVFEEKDFENKDELNNKTEINEEKKEVNSINELKNTLSEEDKSNMDLCLIIIEALKEFSKKDKQTIKDLKNELEKKDNTKFVKLADPDLEKYKKELSENRSFYSNIGNRRGFKEESTDNINFENILKVLL